MSPRAIRSVAFAALVWGSVAAGPAAAQSGGPYDLSWSTIDGGGGRSSGGVLAVQGTIGQPDAGVLSGGVLVLAGGFWKGGWTPDPAGAEEPDGEGEVPAAEAAPLAFRVHPNQPNPFRTSTTIAFDLPEAARVRVEVFDLRGARVKRLVDAPFPAGRHLASWDGTDGAGARTACGVYFARVESGERREVRRVLLLD